MNVVEATRDIPPTSASRGDVHFQNIPICLVISDQATPSTIRNWSLNRPRVV